MGIPGLDRHVGVQLSQHLRVEAPLLAGTEHGRGPPALGRKSTDADAARRSRPRGGDLRAVHDRRRHAGLRIVQDDEPRDVREAALLVGRVAGDPLERGDVVVPQVRRHGVDEGVGPGMNPRLGRQLDPPCADRAVRLLDEVDPHGHIGEQAGDLFPRQVEQAHIS